MSPRGNFQHQKSPRAFQISSMEHFPSQNLPECTPRQADNHHPKMFPKSPKCQWGVILSTRNVLEMPEIIHVEHFSVQKVLTNVQMSQEPHFQGQKSSLRKLCGFGVLYSRWISQPRSPQSLTSPHVTHRSSCNTNNAPEVQALIFLFVTRDNRLRMVSQISCITQRFPRAMPSRPRRPPSYLPMPWDHNRYQGSNTRVIGLAGL